MKKQARFSSVLVAVSIFLASGPLPAAAQMRARVGAGSVAAAIGPGRLPTAIGSGISSPYGSVIGVSALPTVGTLVFPLMPSAGLNTSLAAPSVAPTAAFQRPVEAAAAVEVGEPTIVRTPGPAATRVAEEAAAYAEETPPAAVAAKVPEPARKGLVGRLVDLALGLWAPPVAFDGESREKSAPIFGRMNIRRQEPLSLPNGTATDEQPTVPTADLERIQVYAVPGAPGLTPTSGANRVVLEADPADTDGILRALRARIDGERAHYGVSSSELRLVHAKRFEGRGEQADAIFFYFHRIRDGLVVHGHNISFTVMVINGRPQLVAEPDRALSALDVNTGTAFTDDQIMNRIAERTGLPPADVSTAFRFLEQKIIYSRGAWHNVKLYVAEGLPFMVAVDVVTGLVFAWDNRIGLESASAPGVMGRVLGRTVDKGPILTNSAISEVPLPFLEVTIGAKSYVTDKDGKLPTDAAGEVGPAGLELTATLSGPFVRVENQQGATLTVKVEVKPGDNQVVFNPGTGLEDENTLAQVNVFHKVNMSLAFLRERKLTNERMDKIQLPVRPNGKGSGNAWYTTGNPSLNFLSSDKNFVNTAYDTVAEHENGHFWDEFTGGIVDGGLSEGWGDILSMFRLNNPIIGEHFLKQPRDGADYIRHGENTYQYNEFDEEHDKGQAWGGFAWDLRRALRATLGEAAGAAMAEALVLPTIFAKASSIPEAMAQVLVNATGRDGALLHEAEIRAAAKAHGVNLPNAGGSVIATRLVESLTAFAVLRTPLRLRPVAAGRQNDAGVRAVTAAYAAARALPAPLARPFVKTLVDALGSSNENARTMAGMYLVKLGKKAYGPLLESAEAGQNAASALTVLGSMEDPSLNTADRAFPAEL